jgi:hypothetical protein
MMARGESVFWRDDAREALKIPLSRTRRRRLPPGLEMP